MDALTRISFCFVCAVCHLSVVPDDRVIGKISNCGYTAKMYNIKIIDLINKSVNLKLMSAH